MQGIVEHCMPGNSQATLKNRGQRPTFEIPPSHFPSIRPTGGL
jgi:hypothetical protein